MNVNVPKPSSHLSFLTMLAGPALMNLVTPNEADASDRRNVNPDSESPKPDQISLGTTVAFFSVETPMNLSSL